MPQDASASNRITAELRKKQAQIDKLSNYYSANIKNYGMVNTKGASIGGTENAFKYMDPSLRLGTGSPVKVPGVPQPVNNLNPLFAATIDEIENAYKKDSPDKGGAGYRSMWSVYGQYSKFIDSLRNVNTGDQNWWREWIKQEPAYFAQAKKDGIDTHDSRAMKSYYTLRRDEVAKELFNYIRAGEQSMTKKLQANGLLQPDQNFTLDMVDPYDHSNQGNWKAWRDPKTGQLKVQKTP